MGEIYWGGARRRWRRLEAKMTKPRGQKEECNEAEQIRHRVAADLAGVRRSRARSSSAIRIARGGLGLEPIERGESEGAAGLGRAGSVKPTWVD
jgi:hypothetical protein